MILVLMDKEVIGEVLMVWALMLWVPMGSLNTRSVLKTHEIK